MAQRPSRPVATFDTNCARAQQYRGGGGCVVKRGNHAALAVYLHLNAAGVYYSWGDRAAWRGRAIGCRANGNGLWRAQRPDAESPERFLLRGSV